MWARRCFRMGSLKTVEEVIGEVLEEEIVGTIVGTTATVTHKTEVVLQALNRVVTALTPPKQGSPCQRTNPSMASVFVVWSQDTVGANALHA